MAAACLGQELVLTRLMSLTLYHHFAFLVVSLAMLGMGFGGVATHVFPGLTRQAGVQPRLAWAALGFSISAPWGFVAQQGWQLSGAGGWMALLAMAGKTLALASPFFFVGLFMAIALRHYAADTGRVYGADLLGASLGCLLCIVLLEMLGGRGAVLAFSALGALGAWVLLASDPARRRWQALASVVPLLAAALAAGPLIELRPPNRKAGIEPIVERWNAFSRVGIYELTNPAKVLRETVSSRYNGEVPAAKYIQIDSSAGSHILDFAHGDLRRLDYLLHDIAYVGFQLNDRKGKVLVIGPGGGRDVLAALATGRNDITGVEVNPLIASLVENEFGDYSGHLWRRPGLQLVVDEARSYLARSSARYDFIHASLACTWAATAGGAFVLSENALYTVEAFRSYLDHLNDQGMLSMTMWFRGRPGELLRLARLGQQALTAQGVAQPWQHMVVIGHRSGTQTSDGLATGFGSFLLKKTPFLPAELARLRTLVEKLGFEVLYAPGMAGNMDFSDLLEARPEATLAAFPLDISAPTDDRPFFFYQMRVADFVRTALGNSPAIEGNDPLHRSIVGILVGLLEVTGIWVVLLLLLPLAWKKESPTDAGAGKVLTLLYFSCIGLAFMLVEIPLLQRMTIFLGKPIYAFSVVLFTLLLATGIGSFLSNRIKPNAARPANGVFALLALLLLAMAFLLPPLLEGAMGWSEPLRITLAVAHLVPLGILLGFPLPLMMAQLARQNRGMIPLAWAVNGGSSVLASALAMVMSINWGLQFTLLAGLVCYLAAWALFRQARAHA